MHIHSYYLESTWIFFLLDIETDLKKTILSFKFYPSLSQDLYSTMIIGYEIGKINSKFLPFGQLNEGYQKTEEKSKFSSNWCFHSKVLRTTLFGIFGGFRSVWWWKMIFRIRPYKSEIRLLINQVFTCDAVRLVEFQ